MWILLGVTTQNVGTELQVGVLQITTSAQTNRKIEQSSCDDLDDQGGGNK
jgi:hypothetical protein